MNHRLQHRTPIMTIISRFAPLALLIITTSTALAEGDVVNLVGGDTLRGVIVSQTETTITLDHPALGRIELAMSRVASIERSTPEIIVPPAEPVLVDAAPSVAPVADPAKIPTAILPALAPPPPAKPNGEWKFVLNFSLTGSQNAEASNLSYRAAFGAKRETEADRTTIGLEYYFGSAAGARTDNNLLVSAMEEFLFTDSKWEVFVQTIFQYDEFQDWEQRAGAYAGPGYRLIESESLDLKLRGGIGTSYEFPSTTWTPELLIANQLKWKIDDRSTLTQGFEFFPDIYNLGEYRFIARIDYAIEISPKGDLKATAGVRDEFDSFIVNSTDSSNDLKVYAGLAVDF
jgi:hypothetical protein